MRNLTKRERQVLKGYWEGRNTKEVAATLGISPKTVEYFRANIFDKLAVHTVMAAVHWGLSRHILKIATGYGSAEPTMKGDGRRY